MSDGEKYYGVLLYGNRVGTLYSRGNYTWFNFSESYLHDIDRPVLGLRFEENLRGRYASALRLPPWFSNLLPEGPLREWIAVDRRVSIDREMELLAQVGRDLPGAVQVVEVSEPDDDKGNLESTDVPHAANAESGPSPWRFSLAGVALKFSMLAQGDRLSVPAVGEMGDWLVKFPDYRHADVPRNEFTLMSIARSVGVHVPDVRLVHRDEIRGVPNRMWPNNEEWAYAVRRFDRTADAKRELIHIEDFAQVRDKYSRDKYNGSFETVAALAYRGFDLDALREVGRRLALFVLVGSGDAHFKNWSLIYLNRKVPELSPAYDIVATAPYRDPIDGVEDLGLKLDGSKRFAGVNLATFARFESRIDDKFGRTEAGLVEVARDVARRLPQAWDEHAESLRSNPQLMTAIAEWISEHRPRLLG